MYGCRARAVECEDSLAAVSDDFCRLGSANENQCILLHNMFVNVQ